MKDSANLGGSYPPRPSGSVNNTFLDLQNSAYPTQPHSIIAKQLGCKQQETFAETSWEYIFKDIYIFAVIKRGIRL